MLDRLRTLALFAACLCTVPLVAKADVGPAPSCPTGQTSSYLRGRYCSPTPCIAGSSCGEGAVCAERGLCVQPRSADDPDAPPMALGDCDDASDCVAPSTCERALFCGPPTAASPTTAETPAEPADESETPATSEAARSGGCGGRGCGVARGGSPGVLGFVIALCLFGAFRRRARI